jgi:mazG family protein
LFDNDKLFHPSYMHTRQEKIEALGRVLDVLDTLRVKCPWDAKQTNETLRENTIEEVFELCDALMNDNDADIKKELGDVLLHVCFYAKIGEEKGKFDIADVADALATKLIYRHPHVYGNVEADTAQQVSMNWEQLKLKEKGGNRSILAGVPNALPALIKAYRVQEKAANAGFDWEKPADVWAKVKEEINEFSAEATAAEAGTPLSAEQQKRMEAEMGDVLFSLINAARLYGIHPEAALERTNKKFISRFNHMEAAAKAKGLNLREMKLEQMDALWNEAKKAEQ